MPRSRRPERAPSQSPVSFGRSPIGPPNEGSAGGPGGASATGHGHMLAGAVSRSIAVPPGNGWANGAFAWGAGSAGAVGGDWAGAVTVNIAVATIASNPRVVF